MSTIPWTDAQRTAIETTGCSVLVSAAAGSGKTAVLAERCAYLVCDAPPETRCDVDELLVLTFTEAAAAEMRGRIIDAIRRRRQSQPGDDRLARQVALADASRISTIHSFCLWIVRRWFSDAGIDPAATLLDADEAALLKQETLDRVFAELYETQIDPADPFGRRAAPVVGGTGEANADAPDDMGCAAGEAGRAFVALVDDYALGDDTRIANHVSALAAFVDSLPDPIGWLDDAVDRIERRPDEIIGAALAELNDELAFQREYGRKVAALIRAHDAIGHAYAESIDEYVNVLDEWETELPPTTAQHPSSVAAHEDLCKSIAAFEFPRAAAPRLSKDADPTLRAARDRARDDYNGVKKRFSDRLHKRFGLFSMAEWREGLQEVAPHAATLADLVQRFRSAYTDAKRRMDALDFADLERLAFDLLADEGETDRPSTVAQSLQERFAYVLVDEFQDINPLQQAIIRLVSRECEPNDESNAPRPNNLFAVGDVKQSIYRFRLAEPEIFMNRARAFGRSDGAGRLIALQRNFRSRPEILDAVNLVFRPLMKERLGGIAYDESAELHCGRPPDDCPGHQSVELHLLERDWSDRSDDDSDSESSDILDRAPADANDPSRWRTIEREAYLIATRIRELVGSQPLRADGKPSAYRDIVILLRATKVNAQKIASMLASLGIPALADMGGSLLGALEVRDVMAALRVIDNPRQDIPLAAVLRGGIMGDKFTEDELLEIRCHVRDIPFHACVSAYARSGADGALRDRVAAVLARVGRYRVAFRQKPVSEALWALYVKSGWLAYAAGLPGGAQRRANLLKLHERARQFGGFKTQGLHRFLGFVESLDAEGREIDVASAISEADDVVRIMSIHGSKGLEFPVVFLVGLGTRLNLIDKSGRIIFGRGAGIAPRVVDTDRMIEYPSVAYQVAATEIERATREEELRVLYVAMTRAKEKLILMGTTSNIDAALARWRGLTRGDTSGESPVGTDIATGPALLEIITATTPLDWLVPALSAAPTGSVCWPQDTPACPSRGRDPTRPSRVPARRPVVEVHTHGPETMASWTIQRVEDTATGEMRKAVATCSPLPTVEPMAPGDGQVEAVLARMDFAYPHLASASVRAAIGASEFKGTYDFTKDPDLRDERTHEDGGFTLDWDAYGLGGDDQVPPDGTPPTARDEAARRGVIMHRVLQLMNFVEAADAEGVARELLRMRSDGLLDAEDLERLDRDALVWFVSTPLAATIRGAADRYRREFSYIATESPEYFDPTVGPLPDDGVLVRGIVDGILPTVGGIDIVDYKTDSVRREELPARVERYRPQMDMYARAMTRIWRRPVTACRLVFLTAREVVTLASG